MQEVSCDISFSTAHPRRHRLGVPTGHRPPKKANALIPFESGVGFEVFGHPAEAEFLGDPLKDSKRLFHCGATRDGPCVLAQAGLMRDGSTGVLMQVFLCKCARASFLVQVSQCLTQVFAFGENISKYTNNILT